MTKTKFIYGVALFLLSASAFADGNAIGGAEGKVIYQTGSGLSVGAEGAAGYEFKPTPGLALGLKADAEVLVPVDRTNQDTYMPDVAHGVGSFYVGPKWDAHFTEGKGVFVLDGGYTRNLALGNLGTGFGDIGGEAKVGVNFPGIFSLSFDVLNVLETGMQTLQARNEDVGKTKYFFMDWRSATTVTPCLNLGSDKDKMCLDLGVGWRLGWPLAQIEGEAGLKYEHDISKTGTFYIEGSAKGEAQAVGLVSDKAGDARVNSTYAGNIGVSFE